MPPEGAYGPFLLLCVLMAFALGVVLGLWAGDE